MKATRRGQDLVGMVFGELTVIGRAEPAADGHVRWVCRCVCGNAITIRSNRLCAGRNGTRSCGCFRRDSSRIRLAKAGVWNRGKTYAIKKGKHVYGGKDAWAVAVMRARGKACERCGWNKARCDVHHIIPRSKGGKNTLDNGEVICPNCHRLEHS